MKDPILKTGTARDGLPIRVYGGLHYIKGNSAPHFSITSWVGGDRNGRGGANHEEILDLFPEFAPLVALHLSDIDGVPMHAAGNAIYWAAGVLGGDLPLGQRYHGSNGSSAKGDAECLKILAKHLRIKEFEAEQFVATAALIYRRFSDVGRVKEFVAGYVEGCKPRWKAEADAVIKQFNLVVYGDTWVRSAA